MDFSRATPNVSYFSCLYVYLISSNKLFCSRVASEGSRWHSQLEDGSSTSPLLTVTNTWSETRFKATISMISNIVLMNTIVFFSCSSLYQTQSSRAGPFCLPESIFLGWSLHSTPNRSSSCDIDDNQGEDYIRPKRCCNR